MDVRIIRGKCSGANNSYIFSMLKNRDKSKNHIIIAPDRCLFSLEQSLFQNLKESCFMDINVISLSRLSASVLANIKKKKLLSKQSGIALVKKLLKDNEDKLKSFKNSVNYLGFATTLFETICLYKSCKISPNDVYTDDSSSYANLKQQDIKLIYTEYEKFLSEEYTDSFNELGLFESMIDGSTFPDTIFYIVEFDDFTSIMQGIILKLARFSTGINITCTFDKTSNNKSIYSNKMYYDLTSLFDANGIKPKTIDSEYVSDSTHTILAHNLLGYKYSTAKTNDITISSFDSVLDECKYAISSIYYLSSQKNIDLSDITLVVPSISDYKSYLESVLFSYDLPYYLDEAKSLSSHIFVRHFFKALGIIFGSYTLEDILGLIKSPLLHFSRDGIVEYQKYLSGVTALPYKYIYPSVSSDERISQFLELVLTLRENLKECSRVNDYDCISRELFDYLIAESNVFVESLQDLDRRVFDQMKHKFESISADYIGIFGDNEIDKQGYLDIFKSYFDNTNISLPPIESNTLFIADASSSYISDVKYLFVLGCNEGKMPSQKLDNGLVTDEEISRLPNAKQINPTIMMLNSRRVFKVFELMLKYTSHLYLSYACQDSEGAMYYNNVISSISKIFGLEIKNKSLYLDVINYSSLNIDNANVAFNNQTKKIAKTSVLTYLKDWQTYENNPNYRAVVSTLANWAFEGDNRLLLNNTKEKKLLKKHKFFRNDSTSISQIECYYSCPYKHYARYGLSLRDMTSDKMQPMDIGNIFHAILKSIIPMILKHIDDDDVNLYIGGKATELLDKMLLTDDYIKMAENPSNSIILKSLKLELNRLVCKLIENIQLSNFKPEYKYLEYKFNSENYKIDGIKLNGAIDRVDICGDEFLIIDYKTGSNDFKDYTELCSGKKLQLLVYAKVFEDITNFKPAGVYYMPISNRIGASDKYNGVTLKDDNTIFNIDCTLKKDRAISPVLDLKTTTSSEFFKNKYYKNLCISKEDFDFILDYSIALVRDAIKSITSNDIRAYPLKIDGFSACANCNYLALCGYLGSDDRVAKKYDTIGDIRGAEESNE